MELNTLKPVPGSKHPRKRVARGIGSGTGKTGGRGHKGQRARSGGFHKVGFEGGQMPLQRRLPKRGFKSPLRGDIAELSLSDLGRANAENIDIAVLKAAGIIPALATRAKVIVSGKLARKVVLTGIGVSKGARAAIEAAGGSTDAPLPQPKVRKEPRVVAQAVEPKSEADEAKEAAARSARKAAKEAKNEVRNNPGKPAPAKSDKAKTDKKKGK